MPERHLVSIGSGMEELSLSPLSAEITKAGSRQSYYTIRWLVDDDLVDQAMDAYAYFRWLDDVLDAPALRRDEGLAMVARQSSLMDCLYAGGEPAGMTPQEQVLARLIAHERREHGGLRSYLANMMGVMSFDAGRRGRLISRGELNDYTDSLAMAVMDGLSYFIGNRYVYPESPARYQAVTGAHVCHMLRDAVEDARLGYYNIPRGVLEAAHISPNDVNSPAYREWVAARVGLARRCFRDGRRYILRLRNARAVLAGLAYCGRFERVLNIIERDGFHLRPEYRRDRRPSSKPQRLGGPPRLIPPSRSPLADAG